MTKQFDKWYWLNDQSKLFLQNGYIKGDEKDPAFKTFKKSVSDINKLAGNVNKTLEMMLKAEEGWFWKSILKLFKQCELNSNTHIY